MSLSKLKYLSLLVSAVLWWSCEKEEIVTGDPSPPISEVPEIWLGTVLPQYQQFDDVIIPVNYKDGNGDIGFADADSAVVFVTDNRNDLQFGFHVQPLTPEGVSVPITGTLEVVVENVILVNGTSAPESVTFTVQLRDRQGNWSNSVTTTVLTINP